MTMAFPPEIVERILFFCDGKSLLVAKKVCRLWRDTVFYLSEKTDIWHSCCDKEIPPKELIHYLNSYNEEDATKWVFIYKNWLNWQNIHRLHLETTLCPVDIAKITCIDVFEDYIAIGSADGRVRIYNQYWRPLHIIRHQSEIVTKVSFLYTEPPHRILKIVIAYPKTVIIDDIYGDGFNHVIMEDVVAHSIYKRHICCQKSGCRLAIDKLSRSPQEGGVLKEIWFTRVYNPLNITGISMWNGVCTFVINQEVRKVFYTKKLSKFSNPEQLCLDSSSLPNFLSSPKTHHILRDDVIIVWSETDTNLGREEYMEIIIIIETGTQYSKKLFNTSDVLDAKITCIYLYGNTFCLGVDSGIIYFYHVPSWIHFSIKDYKQKVIVGRHPITNIVAKESKQMRKFYVTSNFNIHEIIGLSIS